MVWHFCGKASTKKIELIQGRTLQFLLNNQRAHIMNYEKNVIIQAMLIRRIKTIAMEVFKSLHDLSPNFTRNFFLI